MRLSFLARIYHKNVLYKQNDLLTFKYFQSLKPYCYKSKFYYLKSQENASSLHLPGNNFVYIREKYTKNPSSKNLSDEDSDSDEEEFKDEKDSRVLKTAVNSLRADLVLKAGLGMARNKVEVNFYDSRIRVNGKKLFKKSIQLNVGDEIDIIKGFSQMNPTHLVISRVHILSAKEKEEKLTVNLRRYKSLVVENYEGQDAYKSSDNN